MKTWKLIVAASAVLFATTTAQAGTGSSPQAIRAAIASNSVDAISAELERAERLMCGACVAMVQPLIDHPDARIRRVASWWLARRGLRSDLFVQMAYRLAQPDSIKARNAADVLGSLRAPKAIEPLGAALNNPIFDDGARVAMAAALGRIGEADAQPALRVAMTDRQPAVRAAAIAAWRELRGPLDAEPALPLVADADPGVRAEALYTLGATRGKLMSATTRTAFAETLAALLQNDADVSVRRRAAWALGEISAPANGAGYALTQAAAHDRDPAVRSLAQIALAKLAR